MRHHNGETAILRSHTADALRGTVRIQRITFGHFTVVVHESKRDQFTRRRQLRVIPEFREALAMRDRNRHMAAGHAIEEQRRTFRHLHHGHAGLELLGTIAHEMRPMPGTGN